MTKSLFAIATTTTLTLLFSQAKTQAFNFATDAAGNPLSNGAQVHNQWTTWDLTSNNQTSSTSHLVDNTSPDVTAAGSVKFNFDDHSSTYDFQFSDTAVQKIKLQYGSAISDRQWQPHTQDIPQLPEPSVCLGLVVMGLIGSRKLVKKQGTAS